VSVRFRQAALLVLLAVLAALGATALPAATPLRILAGLALSLALPWLAASRLPVLRDSDVEGGRIAGAGALAVALTILLGLLLSTDAAGIERSGIAIGLVLVVAALAALGVPGPAPTPLSRLRGRNLLGPALTALAIAIAIAAFVLARDRALTQAREETAYAAFLVENGEQLDVGVSNAANRPARFTVHEVGQGGRTATIVVPAKSTRAVKGFLHRPPPLRPIERFRPTPANPVKVHVTARVAGRRASPVLELSTYAP